MPESIVMKRAIAAALKELMESKSFEKISVTDICDKCRINRTTFYYHFKDKADLVNWVFDTEFAELPLPKTESAELDFLYDICKFFYKNRAFYRKAMQVQGQNSLTDHVRQVLFPLIHDRIKDIVDQPLLSKQMIHEKGIDREKYIEFYVDFYTSAIKSSLLRFLEDEETSPEEFMIMLNACAEHHALHIYTRYNKTE